MAKLLVSVRSEGEARAALAGGAAIIDIKEPSRGSLGMAPFPIWRVVREAVPPSVPVSTALGELSEWDGRRRFVPPVASWEGIAFRKLGLSEAGPSWRDRWRAVREQIDRGLSHEGPRWVAVIYLDWAAAGAPDPDSVIDEAAGIEDCEGILFDTWDKSHRVAFDLSWGRWIDRAKESGRFVALAGSLDEAAIRALRPLEPDIFAVRGAACRGGERDAAVDPERVARLVEAAGTPA